MSNQPIPGITFGIDEFKGIKPGDIFDTGVTETKEIHIVLARWVAYKNHDGTWTIRFHYTKHTTAFIKNNGALCTNVTVIRDLVPCTDEIFAKYRFI